VAEISLILPTRNRTSLVYRALDSIVETAEHPDKLEVVLYVDDDDLESQEIDYPSLTLIKLIQPRARMGEMTQACYAASHGRYVMLFNDDVVCRTSRWDELICQRFDAFADGIALLWGNDLFRGAAIPSHPVLSRTVCDLLGGVCPGAYHRDYIDVHLYDVFCQLRQRGHDRRLYLPDVVFEHLHPEAGKGACDRTSYKNRHHDDELTYLAWADERTLAAARLARHIATWTAHPSPDPRRAGGVSPRILPIAAGGRRESAG
jgi:hypothetical protein